MEDILGMNINNNQENKMDDVVRYIGESVGDLVTNTIYTVAYYDNSGYDLWVALCDSSGERVDDTLASLTEFVD